VTGRDMDPLTFQVQLEQLLEEMLHEESHTVATGIRHLRHIGRYLLIGQEFLTDEQYQTVLLSCGIIPEYAAMALMHCNQRARLQQRIQEIQAHGLDMEWLNAQLQQAWKELGEDEQQESDEHR
jgi:hypothetical protein